MNIGTRPLCTQCKAKPRAYGYRKGTKIYWRKLCDTCNRKKKKLKILFLYPNLNMSALMPQVIGIFTALFKREGYTIDLFDCTFYQDIDVISLGKNANEERVANRNTSAYSNEEWSKKGGKRKWGIKEDFLKKIQDFRELILITFLGNHSAG